jgi:hypothetical protein
MGFFKYTCYFTAAMKPPGASSNTKKQQQQQQQKQKQRKQICFYVRESKNVHKKRLLLHAVHL